MAGTGPPRYPSQPANATGPPPPRGGARGGGRGAGGGGGGRGRDGRGGGRGGGWLRLRLGWLPVRVHWQSPFASGRFWRCVRQGSGGARAQGGFADDVCRYFATLDGCGKAGLRCRVGKSTALPRSLAGAGARVWAPGAWSSRVIIFSERKNGGRARGGGSGAVGGGGAGARNLPVVRGGTPGALRPAGGAGGRCAGVFGLSSYI